jgi:hypothetical protein
VREHFPAPYNEDARIGGQALTRHMMPWPRRGFVVLVFPQPVLGQSGRRNPQTAVSAGGAYPVLLWGPASLDDSSTSQTFERHILASGTTTGAVIKNTRCSISRSISRSWALPSVENCCVSICRN